MASFIPKKRLFNTLIVGFLAGVIVSALWFKRSVQIPDLPEKLVHVTPTALPKWRLTLDAAGADKLKAIRKLARHRQWYSAAGADWTKAQLSIDDKIVKLKIRPKGDLVVDHFQEDNYSLRCKVRDNDAVAGLQTFSLMHPSQRGWLWEWLYHRLLKDEQLMGLSYSFVDLTINGHDFGPYAVEEHFGKSFSTANKRRRGPIVRWRENELWGPNTLYEKNQFAEFQAKYYIFTNEIYRTAEVDIFRDSAYAKDDVLQKQAREACNLLDRFRHRTATASQIFHVDNTAKFFALNEILGGIHGLEWRNMRFHYDPIMARLEPVGFDGQGAGRRIDALVPSFRNHHTHRMDLWEHLFSDAAFARVYVSYLDRFSKKSWLNDALARYQNDLDGLSRTFADAGIRDQSKLHFLHLNAEFVRRLLNPPNPAGLWRQNNGRLRVANLQSLPLHVHAVVIDGTRHEFDSPLSLPTRWTRAPIRFTELPVGIVARDADVIVELGIPGLHSHFTTKVRPWTKQEPNRRELIVRRNANVSSFPFLIKEVGGWRIPRGSWSIKTSLILGPGEALRAGPGAHLQLSNGASVVTYGPLELTGQAGDPVVLQGLGDHPGGIVVLGSEKISQLSHVLITGLAPPTDREWTLTGALTFHEANVDITNSVFDRCLAEDALNIIRSNASLSRCAFSDNSSDAIDFDFCKATLTECTFSFSGNDAIDVSGTRLELNDVTINQAQDKGLSAGEASHVIWNRGSVTSATTGVAAKDHSRIWLNTLHFSGCSTDLSSIVKKAEFGPAELFASNITSDNDPVATTVGPDSSLTLDGKPAITREFQQDD